MDYSFYLKAAETAEAPDLSSGASGYFSTPSPTLDPALFDGDRLRPEARAAVLAPLMSFLAAIGLQNPDRWLHLWITGSAITYQWDADRGHGDLDVMLGISYTEFLAENPEFSGTSPEDFAGMLTSEMKTSLWPHTASVPLGGKPYEITYYLNPRTQDDISVINPYAALNVLTGDWEVRPPELPENPRDLYPAAWFDAAARDTAIARQVTSGYQLHLKRLAAATPGSPGWHNAGASLNLLTAQAQALFDDLHTGRRQAFSGTGQGYQDWHNYRWQAGKASGAVQALHALTTIGVEARRAQEAKLYGQPLDPADITLRRAAAAHRHTLLSR
jgi:hypothetical protein